MTAGSARQDGRRRKRKNLEVKAQQHGKVMLALHLTTFQAVSKLRVAIKSISHDSQLVRSTALIKLVSFLVLALRSNQASFEFVTKSSASVFLKLNQ